MKSLKLVFAVAFSTAWLIADASAAQQQDHTKPAVTAAAQSTAAADLRASMRKLWTDHTVWTRDYIIAAVDDKPDATAAGNRLMQNKEDTGNARAAEHG